MTLTIILEVKYPTCRTYNSESAPVNKVWRNSYSEDLLFLQMPQFHLQLPHGASQLSLTIGTHVLYIHIYAGKQTLMYIKEG